MWVFFFLCLQNAMQIKCCSPRQWLTRVLNLAHRSSPVVSEYFRLMQDDAISGVESDSKITCSIMPPKLEIEARKPCSACGCKQLGPRRLSLTCYPMLTAITNFRLDASRATARHHSTQRYQPSPSRPSTVTKTINSIVQVTPGMRLQSSSGREGFPSHAAQLPLGGEHGR